MKTLLSKLFTIFLILGIWSCGPNFYLRKAERALKKAEQLGAVINHDTIWKTMEIPVPEVSTDTVFKSEQGDTVYISKDRLKIKYVNLPGDSVFIEGKCEADTVVKEVPVTIERKIEAGITPWKLAPWILAVLVFGFIVGYFVKKS